MARPKNITLDDITLYPEQTGLSDEFIDYVPVVMDDWCPCVLTRVELGRLLVEAIFIIQKMKKDKK
jgi:hypothetical protein